MADKFNLLIITPDQLRADYLSCYGHPFINTQHIDALAERGVRFERCYCAAPLCGPSRISFVTSTYVGEHGHRNYGSTIDFRVPNLVAQLKRAGYRLGMFGKNHCFTYEQLPMIWDELDEICLGNYDGHPKFKHSFSSFTLEPDHEYNITARLTDEAIDFIQRNKGDRPFLLWVNYQDPHPAFTCPEPYASMFNPADFSLPPSFYRGPDPNAPRRLYNWWVHSEMALATEEDVRKAMAHYCGQIRYIDDQVGRLWTTLEEAGLTENTIVLFFADHGEFLADQGVFHKLPVFYECLVRIPVILYAPQTAWQGRVYRGLVEEVDLTPTLLDLLGLSTPLTMVGRSLLADLQQGRDEGKEDVLVEAGIGAPTPQHPLPVAHKAPFAPNSFGPGAMIFDGRYKLSFYADDTCELYDLEQDPFEMHNLYFDPTYQSVRQQLEERLLRRLLGVRMRDVGVKWPGPGIDPRSEPLETSLPNELF
ncbi:MAG: sulfatase-like hydrolase/transferase [Anaerolineae bacterium]|nr:sulfatase-like hydrolase/transferase [Anaerolineae bacterium]